MLLPFWTRILIWDLKLNIPKTLNIPLSQYWPLKAELLPSVDISSPWERRQREGVVRLDTIITVVTIPPVPAHRQTNTSDFLLLSRWKYLEFQSQLIWGRKEGTFKTYSWWLSLEIYNQSNSTVLPLPLSLPNLKWKRRAGWPVVVTGLEWDF